MFHLMMYLNFRSKKKKLSKMLNMIKRNSISNEVKRSISNAISKNEPKVIFVPNIATNSEEITISIVSYTYYFSIPILRISLTSYFVVNVDADPHNSLQIFFITSKPKFFVVI